MDQLITKVAVGTAAAVVGGKYLDAKIDLLHDLTLIKGTIGSKLRLLFLKKKLISELSVWPAKIDATSSMPLKMLQRQLLIDLTSSIKEKNGRTKKLNSRSRDGEIISCRKG